MKKQVPKKLYSRKEGTQLCLDSTNVLEITKHISPDIDIIGASIRFGLPIRRKKKVVPSNLRKLGVTRMQETLPVSEVDIVLDEISKTKLLKNINEVAKIIGEDVEKAVFKHLVLRKGDAVVRFKATTKEMLPKNEADLRKKIRVLGAEAGHGKVSEVFAAIGAKKFTCQFENVEIKRVALCKIG